MYSFYERIILALDVSSEAQALDLARSFQGKGVKFKIGMELFYSQGPGIVEKIQKFGDVFLDLKLHDIPETMAKSAVVLTKLGVWMLNVHASAGKEALRRVSQEVHNYSESANTKAPILIAVTLLTSLKDLVYLGSSTPASMLTRDMANMAYQQGFDGIVCSPQEAKTIKSMSKQIVCVTPGVRMPGEAVGDQIRIATPKEAIKAGSDYLVIGRPVTQAKDPIQALEKIVASMA